MPFYCCFRLLKEFLDELFGESWPCGEEVVFNFGYQCGCAWDLQRAMMKGAQMAFDLGSYRLPAK